MGIYRAGRMIVLLVRLVLVLQVILFFALAPKTTFASRMFALDIDAHHKLFLIVFVFLAFLSCFPRYISLLITSVMNNYRYCLFFVGVGLIGFELIIRVVYPSIYPTYSYLMENPRYVVDDKESLFSGLLRKGDYFAFAGKQNLNINVFDKRYSFSMSVQTNSDGFRFFEKDKAEKRIMVLGDSLTFGVGVDNGKTYASQLGELLEPGYEVHNYGVGGWSFAEYYLAHKKYSEKYDFPLVIIGIYPGNDFAEFGNSRWKGKEEGELPIPPLKREDIIVDEHGGEYCGSSFYRTPVIREIAVVAFFEKVVLAPLRRSLRVVEEGYLNRYSTEEMSLKIVSEITKKSNLLVLLLPPQFHYPDVYSPDDYVKKLESIEGVNVLNFYPIFADGYKEMYVDGVHYNVMGNNLVAKEVYGYIKRKGLL